MHVPADAIVGVIGPNGAGKSTLLKAAFGYLRPSAGRMILMLLLRPQGLLGRAAQR